jgi:hypothetical protein
MSKKESPITIIAVGQSENPSAVCKYEPFVRFVYQRDCDKRPSKPLGLMLSSIRSKVSGERPNEMTGPATRAYSSWLKKFDEVGLEAMLNVAVRSA